MANPTTNYGFVLPTPTDLVTDLPADFDVALQGVDTRLKALQPGTTLGDLVYASATANTNTRLGIGTAGQVLAVSGGVPAWTTTADVTPLTTKGDLFTFTTVDARLGVGTNGQTLVADSAEATGLKWAAPAASAFNGANVYKTTQQTVSTLSTFVALTWGGELYDTNSYHDNSTNNSRLTVPTTGYYRFNIATTANAANWTQYAFYKNGSQIKISPISGTQVNASLDYAATAGDYFEVFVYVTSSTNFIGSDAQILPSNFSVEFLGS